MLSTEQYYRNTVDMNEKKIGGWATFYYGTMSNIIRTNNFKKVVEVGIGYGLHAKEMLKNSDLEKLYLVDPMKFYPNDGFATDVLNTIPKIPNNQFNELLECIMKELEPWKNRFTLFRKESLNILEDEIPDESIDCVFIDGDHSYIAVKNDLEFWWKKIRPGGMMLGDDYWMSDVSRAVHEFGYSRNLIVSFAENPANSSYKIFQFIKS